AQSVDDISSLAQELGGWVVSSNRSQKHRGSISIRIPADQLDAGIARLRNMAVEVESEVTSSEDVTDQYVDLTARLKNQSATEEALLKLPQPEIAGPVREWISNKFVAAQVAGRV
ncbi:MAG: DUF4349 domain-containing protein, partial [Acidobacteria bacterium]|nr:DUF4349 domain-containing protein [Acidobacteriota bacterium]